MRGSYRCKDGNELPLRGHAYVSLYSAPRRFLWRTPEVRITCAAAADGALLCRSGRLLWLRAVTTNA